MSCANVKRLCDKLVISTAVTFADGTLTINIPAANYGNGCKYCFVVAQAIPAETTITAPVVITIGDGTTEYDLVGCDCSPVTACSINTRTRYSVVVSTNTTTGVFKLLGKLPCSRCADNLASLPVAEAATP
ncbi:MAG: hypothetical protein J6Q75_02315 [Bacteroidaceae bacterium]|nr:hypothetical protein [Bacteroidaceae bacterium]